MAKGRREIPPCSKTYGFPIYCAAFVPLAEIAAAKKDDEDDDAADGGGSGEGGGGGGGGDRLVAALGGGGGEGRSGVPNALVVASFDLPSRSLSDQPVFRMGTNADVPYRMAVHPKGDGIICSFPKSCRWFEWDLLEGKELHNLALKPSGKILEPLEDVGLQLALSFNEEGSLLATDGEDGCLRVFKWPSMESILEESVDNTSLKDLDFSSNGKFLASLRSSGPCRVWDLTSAAVVANLPREDGEIFGFCRFSHGADDNQTLYVTAMHGDRGRIVSWNVSSWRRIGSKSIVRDPISAFNVSSDGKFLAIGTVEGTIIVLRSADMQVHATVKKAHLGIVTAVVFSQDSRALLSSSFDSTARVTVIDNKKSKEAGTFQKKYGLQKMQSIRVKPRGMLSHLLLLLTPPPPLLATSASRPSPRNTTLLLLLRSSSPPSPPPPPPRLLPRSSLLGAPPHLRSGRSFSVAAAMADEPVSYISQRDAAEIDEALMGPLGFSVDQLMELAGLSVAAAIAEVYKLGEYSRVLAICGPGNNGGDGLVAARHLYHFGYKPFISYPKRTSKPLYSGLVTQLESLSIPFLSVEDLPQNLSDDFDIIVDAMFGFSFHGTPRPPFDDLIQRLVALKAFDNAPKKLPPIVSVDIPSGWHVEEGDINGEGIKPEMLVSLTAPKLCAKKFVGPHHFLGGRFVPPAIKDKYGLRLPPYPGTSMCVRIGKPPSVDIASLRENYTSPELLEDQVMADPVDQFQKWFDEAVSSGLREPNAMALSTSCKDGKPSSRMVLLKGVDKQGFVWYTNYESRKARELSENPYASLLFHWNHLDRQVRIEGSVEKVSDEESERYFHSRPRGSQLGAVVSKQSTVLAGRHVIHQAYMELEERYSDGKVIPKPDYWGGYRLTPRRFEFWQGQPSRLHDRLQYVLREVNGSQVWQIERLSP